MHHCNTHGYCKICYAFQKYSDPILGKIKSLQKMSLFFMFFLNK